MFMKLLTLLTASTLLIGSASAEDSEFSWPPFARTTLGGVNHNCVDLEGYAQLNHIWEEYQALTKISYTLRLELEDSKIAIEQLLDQLNAEQEYSDHLEMEVDGYRLALDSKNNNSSYARIRETALWATVVLEAAAIVLMVTL